eukprot:3147724-Pyramimonas_sp.AAC.1
MLGSFSRMLGSQWAAQARARFISRSCARSASRRGPSGGSRVCCRFKSRCGNQAIRRRLIVSGMVSTCSCSFRDFRWADCGVILAGWRCRCSAGGGAGCGAWR